MRTKGALNLKTMIRLLKEAGKWREGLETEPREKIKAVYESMVRANSVPTVGTVPDGQASKPLVGPLPTRQGGINTATTPSVSVIQPVIPATVAPVAVPAQKTPGELLWQEAMAEHVVWCERRREEIREIKRTHVKLDPPCSRDFIVDTTVIEGRPVIEWSGIMDERKEAANKHQRTSRTFAMIDYSGIPGWATWAVEQWVRLEKPTTKGRAETDVSALIRKANEADRGAVKHDAEALEADKYKEVKAARKAREKAEQKRAKAVELRKQADEIGQQHNIKVVE